MQQINDWQEVRSLGSGEIRFEDLEISSVLYPFSLFLGDFTRWFLDANKCVATNLELEIC